MECVFILPNQFYESTAFFSRNLQYKFFLYFQDIKSCRYNATVNFVKVITKVSHHSYASYYSRCYRFDTKSEVFIVVVE